MVRVGVIGGTGVYAWIPGTHIDVETPWGEVRLTHARTRGIDWFFLPRHGERHQWPPHRVNYRANVRALADAKVDAVFALYNTGALDPKLGAGSWVVPSDLFDHTTGRARTYHDDRAVHVNSAEPFCPTLRRRLVDAGPKDVHAGGFYVAMDGPQLETRVQAQAYADMEGTVIGMTAAPEAFLAHELGLCFAALCFVANAAGTPGMTAQGAQAAMRRRVPRLRSWLESAAKKLPSKKACPCPRRMDGATLTLGGPR